MSNKFKKNYYAYPAVFDDSENEQGTYTVTVPDVQGVITDGKGMAEAMTKAKEALELALYTEGVEYPASSLEKIQKENPNKIVNYVVADMIDAKRIVKPAWVKKNTRIPGDLAAKAEKAGINFSKLLIKSLEKELGENDYSTL